MRNGRVNQHNMFHLTDYFYELKADLNIPLEISSGWLPRLRALLVNFVIFPLG